ncbi:MAG: electron transport complex subunit RsxG [Oleispira sp.]|nr:electron transport complex subunit RsxG [Oleispira sp.]
MKELLTSIRKNAIGLGLFAIVTAGSIGIAQVTTKDSIQKNIQIAQAKALHEIVPKSSYDNDLLNDTISLASNESHDDIHARWNVRLLGPIADDAVAYVARKDGKAHTIILPVTAPDGYTTNIDMIVGIKLDGTLAGVRVINHKETPGLGDKIEAKKHPWILQFSGLSLLNPAEKSWAVKKDGGEFDQFTGATITPRAVVRSVRLALTFFQQHGQELAVDKDYIIKSDTIKSDTIKSDTLKSDTPQHKEDLAHGE